MFCSQALQKGQGRLSLPGHGQVSEDTGRLPVLGESKAAFTRRKPFGSAWPGVCFGSSGAAHLGAGGHGDVQVAENVLGVLILHCLAQK